MCGILIPRLVPTTKRVHSFIMFNVNCQLRVDTIKVDADLTSHGYEMCPIAQSL